MRDENRHQSYLDCSDIDRSQGPLFVKSQPNQRYTDMEELKENASMIDDDDGLNERECFNLPL